ncbi:MAG: S28 family serine protease [Candidatus Aminicenantes bacterium]|nr:S28 family serine protease [Candidatus Aminicenantes bacterium]
MIKKWFSLLAIFCMLLSCSHGGGSENENETLLQKLQKLPDVIVTEIAPPQGYLQAFQIDVGQPVDHRYPNGSKFHQRIYLSHLGDDRPMVLSTRGYGVTRNSLDELTILLNANQIVVTHRYFPNAKPSPVDWRFLNIWQAASDHHRIVQMFKPLYPGKWVNEGASKGGMTAFYHRRFFPADVTATVAYVAPMMFGVEDPRFRAYLLEQAGTPADRDKIKAFQRLLLSRRAELLVLVQDLAARNGFAWPLGDEATLEYAVLEYLFSFWQYGDGDTSKIPAADAAPDVLFNYLDQVSGFSYYSPATIAYYESFYYQAYSELGYTPYVYDHLVDLLAAVPAPTYRVFAPAGVAMNFDAGAMIGVNSWLQASGNNIIYIYGANDPYTSAAVELTGQTNALRVIQPNANHLIRIAGLDERERVLRTLGEWLGISISTSVGLWERAAVANREQAALNREESRLGGMR